MRNRSFVTICQKFGLNALPGIMQKLCGRSQGSIFSFPGQYSTCFTTTPCFSFLLVPNYLASPIPPSAVNEPGTRESRASFMTQPWFPPRGPSFLFRMRQGHYRANSIWLGQGCQTYAPWAGSSPWSPMTWPVGPRLTLCAMCSRRSHSGAHCGCCMQHKRHTCMQCLCQTWVLAQTTLEPAAGLIWRALPAAHTPDWPALLHAACMSSPACTLHALFILDRLGLHVVQRTGLGTHAVHSTGSQEQGMHCIWCPAGLALCTGSSTQSWSGPQRPAQRCRVWHPGVGN